MILLCSDYDGTLHFKNENDSGYFKPEDLKEIKIFQEKGNLFSLCTGRIIDTIQDDLIKNKFQRLLSSENWLWLIKINLSKLSSLIIILLPHWRTSLFSNKQRWFLWKQNRNQFNWWIRKQRYNRCVCLCRHWWKGKGNLCRTQWKIPSCQCLSE